MIASGCRMPWWIGWEQHVKQNVSGSQHLKGGDEFLNTDNSRRESCFHKEGWQLKGLLRASLHRLQLFRTLLLILLCQCIWMFSLSPSISKGAERGMPDSSWSPGEDIQESSTALPVPRVLSQTQAAATLGASPQKLGNLMNFSPAAKSYAQKNRNPGVLVWS